MAFLKGTKDQCVDAPTLGFEYFQRPAAPGEIESKVLFNHRGHLSTTEYWLKDGMYTVYGSLILRIEYEDGVQEEKRMARALGERAYTYQLQSSSAATGTNDCFIIRRTMSEPLLAAVDASYAAFAPSLKTKEERLPNISVFHDYYVRKTDGIIMGFLELNAAGHMRGDRLCDIMLLGTAAPDAEFTPPNKSHATVVSSFHQFADLTFDEMLKFENNSPAPAHKGKSYVTMCVVISFSLALLVFLWRASRRRVSW